MDTLAIERKSKLDNHGTEYLADQAAIVEALSTRGTACKPLVLSFENTKKFIPKEHMKNAIYYEFCRNFSDFSIIVNGKHFHFDLKTKSSKHQDSDFVSIDATEFIVQRSLGQSFAYFADGSGNVRYTRLQTVPSITVNVTQYCSLSAERYRLTRLAEDLKVDVEMFFQPVEVRESASCNSFIKLKHSDGESYDLKQLINHMNHGGTIESLCSEQELTTESKTIL